MPDWKPLRKGDRVRHSAHSENKLCQRAFRPMSVSSHASGIQTPNLTALSPEPPHREYEVEITNLKASSSDTENSALYLCRARCYGTTNTQWESRASEYLLDALDVGSQLFVGARITARWDIQRGAFIPCHPSIGAAILTSKLVRCGTATAKVLNRDYDELQIITVKDFIDILAGDWRDELAIGSMVYFLPVSYHSLNYSGNLAGSSVGSNGQYEIIAAGGNCVEDLSSQSTSSQSTSAQSTSSQSTSQSSISTSSLSESSPSSQSESSPSSLSESSPSSQSESSPSSESSISTSSQSQSQSSPSSQSESSPSSQSESSPSSQSESSISTSSTAGCSKGPDWIRDLATITDAAPSLVLGADANGCLAWYSTTACP